MSKRPTPRTEDANDLAGSIGGLIDDLKRQRDEAREQLDRICRDGFGYQDTIGLEPCADYVLRKLNQERELARELRDAMKAITPYIGYPSTPTDVIYQFKNTLTKAKEVLP